MADDVLKDLRERFEFCKSAWQDIRDEAATDMQFVGGDPWTTDDRTQRAGRPIIAPEEMGQYFNQVINALRANPRGVKFAPIGNGANDQTARFYQNKAREIEYRSHAQIAYMQAAENAIQRSYGHVRVETRYVSPRSANQELWIEGFPDPDMVFLDPEAKRPDSSDMQFGFVVQWSPQREVRKRRRPKLSDFTIFAKSHPSWVQGDKVLEAEYWTISTKKRKLVLVQPPPMAGAPGSPPLKLPRPVELFADELPAHPGATPIRDLREVDYPTVKQYLTDGLEIFDETAWPGKYIPIVSCYGKVLWVPEAGQVKRKILSMTRFGRDPWKAYCYACCQELEVLAMVPKTPLLMYEGQMDATQLDQLVKSMHQPVAAVTFKGTTPGTGEHLLPPPGRSDYTQGQYLQAIEVVKEGYRRAIQSAMGSNFLPTQAQRRNEKSGKALDKMEQAATQGTYHFVNSFEDMLRQVGVIEEDLIPHIHSQQGETGVMEADGTARIVRINDPADKDAFSTTGDHVVTVSTAPSSDSEAEAAADYTTLVVGQLPLVARIAGPKVAAAVFAMATRMRNLGPRGDQLADLIEPPEYKAKDGKPPAPELVAAQGQIQHLTQLLQQAAQEKQSKVVEQDGKFKIEQMKVDATSADKAADREVKLAVAELGAKVDKLALFLEESRLIGARIHDVGQAARERIHDSVERAKDRAHERLAADVQHDQALEQADAGVQGQLAVQAAAPQPETGVGA